jgi:hypothetical protein
MTNPSTSPLQSQVEQAIHDAVHGDSDIPTAAEVVLALVAPQPRSGMSPDRAQGFLDAVTMLDLGRKRRASRWLRRLTWYQQALAAVAD